MGSIYALVAAAGRSTRMGVDVNKQLLELAGRPVVVHALQALAAVPLDGIILVVAPGEKENFHQVLNKFMQGTQIKVISGGDSRRDSVMLGLRALPSTAELVVVHDGARPLIKPERIRETIRQARHWGAATLAVPAKDTIKVAGEEGLVRETLLRDKLWQVQTPQVFKYQLLVEAHRVAAVDGYSVTDDASLVERLDHPVKLVRGDYTNIKITTPEDMVLARALLREA
ncbi:putative 2-C-methyl-D-erythritol 4-phosphate cytidylyltransferase 2 [Sporotomaculum syntrophicum]|uniref:2-C-methyl-D-erythritol 4-phosphate cytidylyltransferase n=1 Tax=Sporotomaculum syntrophicum TaxID=182264 RepID=A0A9D2WN35_9FIRM|nr:2-C-methyl-D-erythritol 4-phosphate cytidylyltransferase [Sporotomaculum syntrophicum]KAF1083776.1 putative 2-C-methyl-D-erythritol 4-phosphate cytidylyltransferase 2 [Sporotomaculum syntrophicum]